MDIESYLIQIEDILEGSKTVPFSGKVAVDREAIYEIIDEIRLHMPDEIKEAQKVFENKDKHMRDAEKRATGIVDTAKSDADGIMKDAEAKVARLVSETEVYKKAAQEADTLREEANRDSRSIRNNAIDYADEILSQTEQAVRTTSENISRQMISSSNYFDQVLEVLYNNRQELRGGNK